MNETSGVRDEDLQSVSGDVEATKSQAPPMPQVPLGARIGGSDWLLTAKGQPMLAGALPGFVAVKTEHRTLA